ncbi:pre-rRNA-processing protein-like protein ipi1 [Xylogone sp. PMI_703]|nr:pre-rRNA-processing protein-like protein ipi1 [Xylogone sp. PMI_703]
MGSSAKKKKEKQKDFQKAKLRVGKTKPKADNFTDTSFRAKSIVVNQQSLSEAAPTSTTQFTHNLSLASSSRSETQRRDSLSYLTKVLSTLPVSSPQPLPTAIILPKLLPLFLDGSSSVRTQLLRLLRLLPAPDIADHAESILLYLRAGITHLSSQISMDALAGLDWALEVAANDMVSCAGGWVKTLKCLLTMLGWTSANLGTGTGGAAGAAAATAKWSSASKGLMGEAGKTFPKKLTILSKFLRAGLIDAESDLDGDTEMDNINNGGYGGTTTTGSFPFITDLQIHMIPTRSNAYAHLNLFGAPRDAEGEMYLDKESRQRVFKNLFYDAVKKGVDDARKAGGESGRAAAMVNKVLVEGMRDSDDDD